MTTYRCPDCGSDDLRVELPRAHRFSLSRGFLDIADNKLTPDDIPDDAPMTCADDKCDLAGTASNFVVAEPDTALGLLRELAVTFTGTAVDAEFLDRVRAFVIAADA